MHDQYLPTYSWEEAYNTIVYIHNRIPHAILEEKTPGQVFTAEKEDISHLRIFGCPIYIHVLKEKRKNMEPFGKKETFVGYSK